MVGAFVVRFWNVLRGRGDAGRVSCGGTRVRSGRLSRGVVGVVVAASVLVVGSPLVEATPVVASVQKGGGPSELPGLKSSAAAPVGGGVSGSFESAPPVPGQDRAPAEGFSAEGSVESAVSESSVLYDNPDGSNTLVVSDGPARFRDAGQWREIDMTLVDNGRGGWRPVAAPEAVTVGEGSLARIPVAGGELSLDVPGRAAQASGRLREGAAAKSAPGRVRAGDARRVGGPGRFGDEVVFDGPMGEVEVRALVDGAKTTHVIADASVEVTESLMVPAGWSARQGEGVVELLDQQGMVAARWAGGAVTDSAPLPAESVATMALVDVKGRTVTARAVMDGAWLAAPERVAGAG